MNLRLSSYSIFNSNLLIFSVLFCIFLRLIWILAVPVDPTSDSVAYDTFAKNIVQYGTYGWKEDEPTSYWPVGTSALYAALYFVFGFSYWPIIILNLLLYAGILLYGYRIALMFTEESRVATITVVILCFWPTGIFFSTILASELPYMFFTMAGIYHLTHDYKKKLISTIVAGCLFSIAYYIRPLAIVPMFICFAFLLLKSGNIVGVCARAITVIALLALFVSPWAYRNYTLYNAFVPMSTNGGATLWMGNSANSDGGYAVLPEDVSHLNGYERNEVLKQRAIENIISKPAEFLGRTMKKLVKFHSHETIGVSWNSNSIQKRYGDITVLALKAVAQAYWIIILSLACGGLIIFIKSKGLYGLATSPLILFWSSSALIHSLIVAQDRYHLPVVPYIAVFSAYSIIWLREKITPSTVSYEQD